MSPLASAVLVNLIASVLAGGARALRPDGLVAGFLVGVAVWWGAGAAGWALLFLFVLGGSALTKLGYRQKEALGAAQGRGGSRGAREVLANGLVPAAAALLAGRTGDPVWLIAMAGGLATALADTAASEFGPLYGKRCVLAATLERVPPGTEGAISLEGTGAGILAAAVLAGLGLATGLFGVTAAVAVVLAAALASYLESLLGSLAKSGFWAGNEVQNFLNTLVGAALAVGLSLLLGRGPA
jgi:uncharacterized protein (TIGR00297 family)